MIHEKIAAKKTCTKVMIETLYFRAIKSPQSRYTHVKIEKIRVNKSPIFKLEPENENGVRVKIPQIRKSPVTTIIMPNTVCRVGFFLKSA